MAGQGESGDADGKASPPVEHAAPEAKPEAKTAAHPRFHLPSLATFSSDLRMLFFNFCILFVVLLIAPVIIAQFLRNQIVVEPISAPSSLVSRGLTGDVAANLIWDSLQKLQNSAQTSKTAIDVTTSNQRIDFSIPDSGLSIDSLVYYVRRFFHNYETRISGEIQCADALCAPAGLTLKLRILRDGIVTLPLTAMGERSQSQYFDDAATQVMSTLDPFVVAAAEADTSPDAAIATLKRLIANHMNPDWAFNLLGNIKRKQGDFDAASDAFRAALKISPGFAPAKINLAAVLIDRGDLAGATALYDEVAKSDPKSTDLAIGRARVDMLQGKAPDAIDQLLAADRLDPGKTKYLFMAANDEMSIGHNKEAADYASQALDLDPSDLGSLSLLGVLYLSNQQYDKAENIYRRAVNFSPQDADANDGLAEALMSNDKFTEALTYVETAIKLDSKQSSYLVDRSRVLAGLQRFQDALDQLNAAIAAGAKGDSFLYDIASYDQFLGKTADAIAAYQKFLTTTPDGAYATMAKKEIELLSKPATTAPATAG